MKNGKLEAEIESIRRAVDLLYQLMTIADGGRSMVVEQYEASAILALLMDKPYRVKVMSEIDDLSHVLEED